MRRLLWVVALIALDALLGSWLYGGGYTQAIGRMLVDIETHISSVSETVPHTVPNASSTTSSSATTFDGGR